MLTTISLVLCGMVYPAPSWTEIAISITTEGKTQSPLSRTKSAFETVLVHEDVMCPDWRVD